MRIAEALGWLKISKRTFYRLIAQGELTPIYFDSHPRFDPAEVRDLIESRIESQKETSGLADRSSHIVPDPDQESDGQLST